MVSPRACEHLGRGCNYPPMPDERIYSVMIVEDDVPTRLVFADKICTDPALRVCALAGSCAEAIAMLRNTPPDVMLVDLGLPDGDGTQVIRHAADTSPDTAIMVITVFGDEDRVMRAIRAGATGYILKTDDSRDICAAIHDLLHGGSPISPVIARHLIRRHREPKHADSTTDLDLTNRELDVLRLSAKGYTYQEVAGLLGLSVNTVSSHTRRVYRKLAVSSRSQAVFEATRLGLVDAPQRDK